MKLKGVRTYGKREWLFPVFPLKTFLVLVYSEESLSRLQMVKEGMGREDGTLISKRKQGLRVPAAYFTQKDSYFMCPALSHKKKGKWVISNEEFSILLWCIISGSLYDYSYCPFGILLLSSASVHPCEYISLVWNHMGLIKMPLMLKQIFLF